MRATTLVLLVAGAAALQPALRVHAAARPTRTSGRPVQKQPKESTTCLYRDEPILTLVPRMRPARQPSTHAGIVARAEPEREEGMVDIRPQPRELDSDAELGLTVLAPGIALFALIAVVAQFAHPV